MGLRSEQVIEDMTEIVNEYGDSLFRLCLVTLCCEQDAEDALQETFLRYWTKAPSFNEAEHRKAWLIRVATNICKDMYRFKRRHEAVNIDDLADYFTTEQDAEIMESVLALPPKYKTIIVLHYIEGYTAADIAKIMHISVSAVKKRLQRGREMLKIEYAKGEGL